MPFKLLLFSLGVIAFSYFPVLPSRWWLLILLPILFAAFYSKPMRFVCALALGLCWGLLAGHELTKRQLPEQLAGQDLRVTGQVVGLPDIDMQRLRFEFRVLAMRTTKGELLPANQLPERLQLSWYLPRGNSARQHQALPVMTIGDYWQLNVRLKPPRGFVNPAGFDYQAWLLRRGIGATGYVVARGDNQRLNNPNKAWRWEDWINQQRQQLQQWVMHSTDSSERGILVALLIGDSALVEKPQWQRMQQTGTSHLIAISGLHVGFLALFGYYLGLFVGKWVQVLWRACPAQVFAWLSAIACAAFYSALAGFNIPTVRTLIMLGLFYGACLLQRQLRISDIFCAALALVLLLDPLAAYDMGFWLSFGAVALLLIYFSGRLVSKRTAVPWMGFGVIELLSGFIRSQWVMFIGLILPLSLLVNSVSLVAPIANGLAIPLITFCVVPLLLLAAALGDVWVGASNLLLQIAAVAMEWLAVFLDLLLQLAGAWASPAVAFSLWLLPLLVLCVVMLLLPRGLLPRSLGLMGCALVALLNFVIPKPQQDDLTLTVLDVGQGTAVVAQVGDKTLVYDTGPRYTRSFDAGSAIVAPYLQSQGVRALDYVVISHWDTDHAGGLEGLQEKLPINRLLIGEPVRSQATTQPSQSCHEYAAWHWQQVSFRFLAIPERARNNRNNHSCVLLISYGDEHILLPGDIETRAEYQLLYQQQLPSSLRVLLAAHHGSRTSSGALWVERTRPSYVVYSAGYRSQHGHPHPQVQARYKAVVSKALNTAEQGALIFRWREGSLHSVSEQRQVARRYWYP